MFTKKNPNIKSYYYAQQGGFRYQEEVERMAKIVLERMDDWKHLIDLPPKEEEEKCPDCGGNQNSFCVCPPPPADIIIDSN